MDSYRIQKIPVYIYNLGIDKSDYRVGEYPWGIFGEINHEFITISKSWDNELIDVGLTYD